MLLMRCQRKGAQILITSPNIFSTFVKLSDDKASDHTFNLYDGHKSHISLTLSDWARERNLTLFDLPHHPSHLTQPLYVAVFGPFKAIYNSECQA